MSTVSLRDLHGCFDGVIPPILATCSAAGEPNVTHLSQLYLVDDGRVALSNQFFGKTVANLAENPAACVLVTDSQTWDTYRFVLRFVHTEHDGPVFERMRRSLAAVAAVQHQDDVFRLRGADIYEVVAIEALSVEGSA